ncbi:MAG: HNH endonuclease [Gammaproteobacteria bacterium]|nr:MAG: HNH endonuclease [Gammaproteobacteria bacterium]
MRGEILSYFQMCQREGSSLQRGMNYRPHGRTSVILMSRHPNAPYRDELQENDTVLIYEGHDIANRNNGPDPKAVDQPATLPSGRLTENGKFFRAAQEHRKGNRPPERVRVYEKIRKGIWVDNGLFSLVDAWQEDDGTRKVFKFRLVALPDEDEERADEVQPPEDGRSRVIPSHVKLEVWRRDGGKCVMCGATDELHFDHIVPYSRGGTSLTAENVQLLCARHNLQKKDRIQ